MIRAILYILIEVPVQLLGFLVVAVALPFRREDRDLSNDGASRLYSQYPEHGSWVRWRLPKWALWWDNPYDGLTGDKRGWWANECRSKGRTEHDYMSMWIWAALRNPANYFSRNVTGCDVSDCTIEMIKGNAEVVDEYLPHNQSEWHYLVATDSKGRKWARFIGYWPWSEKYCAHLQLGWKIKLDHNGTPKDARDQDKIKGNTIRINIFKERDQ